MKILGRVKVAISAVALFAVAAVVISVSAAGVRAAMPLPFAKAEGRSLSAPVYSMTRSGYFVDSYVVEFGWNLYEASPEYPASAEVTLADGSQMSVSFSMEAKKYAEDEAVKTAVAHLIDAQKGKERLPEIKAPFVKRVAYVPAGEEADFAERYYKNEDWVFFAALFPALGAEVQGAYFQTMYEEDKAALLSCTAEQMDADTVMWYIDKTEQDRKMDLFAVLADHIPQGQVQAYLERYYQDDDIARFSILFDRLPKDAQEGWLRKAAQDRDKDSYNTITLYLLEDGFDKDGAA